ncbi:hypothetical protein [Nocardia carnea]|uniref:hypothetical protein n=1 Tax=Nocardia carnea TaxID=37328 RepID=UPI0024587E9C|nr:hypothetical protein [Nocardia carnea]
MPPVLATLLVEVNQALLSVEILRPESQGASSTARGFDVKAKDQRVEFRVVAGGGGDTGDVGQEVIWEGAAVARKPSRLHDRCNGIGFGGDESIISSLAVERSKSTDHVFGSRASSSAVPADDGLALSQRCVPAVVVGRDRG